VAVGGGAVIYDLIGHGVTLAFVIYFGLHLRQKVQTLQATVAAQEKTITAQEKAITGQAEQMKAQSTVLQDFERLNKLMKEIIDTVDAPAMIERWQKYKTLVDAQGEQLAQQLGQRVAELESQAVELTIDSHAANSAIRDFTDTIAGFLVLAGLMMRFVPYDKRMALIKASEVGSPLRERLHTMAEAAPYLPLEEPSTENLSLAQALGLRPPTKTYLAQALGLWLFSDQFHRDQETP
jgi:uncharacterized coiled-coil protein SlyX